MTAQKLPLADIHVPSQISFWPPAYGWWIVLLLIIIAVYVTVKLIKKRKQERVQRNFALAELMAVDLQQNEAWRQINDILKRAAMVYYSREQVASLTGEKWKTFLLKPLGEKAPAFDDKWLSFSYSPHVEQQNIENYHQFAQLWLKKALPIKGGSV